MVSIPPRFPPVPLPPGLSQTKAFTGTIYSELPDASHLPKEVKDRSHQHILFLTSVKQYEEAPGFQCDKCNKVGNGASYHCEPCGFDLHPDCVVDSEGKTLSEKKKADETKAAVTIQALYRGHSMRKIKVQESDKQSLKRYMDLKLAKAQCVILLLGMRGMAKSVADIVLDYQDEHNVVLSSINCYWPLKFTIENNEYTCTEIAHKTLTAADCRREIAKLIAVNPLSVHLTYGGTEVKADQVVILGDKPIPIRDRPDIHRHMRRGRPFIDKSGQNVTARMVVGVLAKSDVTLNTTKNVETKATPVTQPSTESKVEEKDTPLVSQETKSEPKLPLLNSSVKADWSATIPGLAKAPSLDGLTSQQRRILAERWGNDALAEHASIASFARFTLQLMAVGSPSHLLYDAQRAAADEVRHARICFGLAAVYAGQPVEPGKFPIKSPMELETDLASVAASTATEGCVEETLSCLVMAEACHRCEDPAVRTCLASMVKDEARHAALAWRTVQWALQKGNDHVREAVAAALKKNEGKEDNTVGLERLGKLDFKTSQQVRTAAFKEVINTWSALVLAGKPIDTNSTTLSELSNFPGPASMIEHIVAAINKK